MGKLIFLYTIYSTVFLFLYWPTYQGLFDLRASPNLLFYPGQLFCMHGPKAPLDNNITVIETLALWVEVMYIFKFRQILINEGDIINNMVVIKLQ